MLRFSNSVVIVVKISSVGSRLGVLFVSRKTSPSGQEPLHTAVRLHYVLLSILSPWRLTVAVCWIASTGVSGGQQEQG